MSHRMDRKHRRAASDWVLQTLEGRILLSQARATATAAASALIAPAPNQRITSTSLHASTQTTSARQTVTLVAIVNTAGTERSVTSGRVRFSVVSPTPEVLGVAHLNKFGHATLKTSRLARGGTYEIAAEYLPTQTTFASSTAQFTVAVAEPLVTSFRITAPQYFGAPGTPLSFSVTALDRAGQVVTGYTGTIDLFSPTDRAAKLLAKTYTFTTSDQGTHEFPDGITFHKGGAEVLKVDQTNETKIIGTQRFGIE
jgi:hypothetical protein